MPNSAHLAELITSRGYRIAGSPEACDVVVVGQGAALGDDVRALVSRGVGLVVVLDPAQRPSTGPDADPVHALLASAGLDLDSAPGAGTAVGTRDETATATDLDLLARVDPAELSVTGTMRVRSPAAPLLRTAT